ncbi:class I SAM-dependent methyltransferase [Bradyrhizobium erythrophlei]|uniref:class I SAM-dependent methyltransferase n=1 Tax=Bradyrhizobium erythrophlei TaxID=1437360 RepID=UPI0035E833D4
MSCLACGTAFHTSETTSDEVRTIYGDEYKLAAAAPKSDTARARAYGSWIMAEASAPQTILEMGCGSGALLSELLRMWPDAIGYGIDPALPDTARSEGRIHLASGFVEDIPNDAGPFDLIVAVNVIEHTADPRAFLNTLRPHLTPNGQILAVCPATQPPNIELLFFDHLYSLTPDALLLASQAASLAMKKQIPAPQEIGDFQMVVLAATGPSLPPRRLASFSSLRSERSAYLERWGSLDQTLLDRSRTCSRLLAFGGGQTAALLRAYAPRTWARIELIVLDDVSEAWPLGRPIASYQEAVQNPDDLILVAASPHVQSAIAERLSRDGLRSVTWNDLIPR